MPAVLRRIGPDFVDRKGATRTPRALIKWCETCNYEGATFGLTDGQGKRLWYCGYRDGAATCIGKNDDRPDE